MALPVTVGLLVWKLRDWRLGRGIPLPAALASLFDLRGSYWQGSPMRAILED